MVESSKILTVSYGTFSCTLEGFEDSFSTMKAIAEYFRDLAAEDRYFGAEPPTPDAEMLAKIAERQVAQRVEASTDDNGIVLRAAAAALPAAEAPANDPAPAMPPEAQPPAEEEVAAAAESLPEETSIAAEAVDHTDVATPDAEEDTSSLLAAEGVAAPEFDAESDEEMDVNGASSFAEMAPEALLETPAHPDADSVAAKLQRIRAVVGAGTSTMPVANESGDLTEPFETESSAEELIEENAEAFFDTESDAETETADDFDEIVVEETSEEPTFEEEVEEIVDLDALAEKITGEIETSEESDVSFDEEAETAEVTDETLEGEQAEDPLQLATEIELVEETDADDDISEIETAEEEFDAEEPVDAEIDSDLIASITSASQDSEENTDEVAEEERAPEPINETDIDIAAVEDVADDDKLSITARILRAARPKRDTVEEETESSQVKLDDVVSAIEGSSEEVEIEAEEAFNLAAHDGADELVEFDDIPVSDLSAEDEAELQEELAEVTQEIEEHQVTRNTLPENDDAAMSRIMDETDQQLSEPEGNRRRQAIAQLKAAVAATEAGRQLGDAENPRLATENEFREDLDQVVRPRRAESLPRAEIRTERPRPAPLKLVASQRIDEGASSAEPSAPVAPRRVAKSEEVAVDASNFAEFAAEMGASELPDLLEAAAAYTAYVEGNEDFSRPQIMRKVKLTSAEEFSREDGLRTFGTLLREGRISKVRNGRFQVSEQTRFKPEQKAG